MAIDQNKVNAACDKLDNAGKEPTLLAVRNVLGEGSFATLMKMVRVWRDKQGIKDQPIKHPPQVRDLVRLTSEVYADLEKRHTRLSVSATSTPIEVAFQLGVQSVLRDLRAGYVVQA